MGFFDLPCVHVMLAGIGSRNEVLRRRLCEPAEPVNHHLDMQMGAFGSSSPPGIELNGSNQNDTAKALAEHPRINPR